MAKADLGTKRVCPSCGAKFYDLNRIPVRCPKCEHEYDPDADLKAAAAPEVVEEEEPTKKPEADAEAEDGEDGFGEEADDTPEVDQASDDMTVSDDDDDDASGLSDDLPDGFSEDDVEDNDEDDDTTVLIDEEEDEGFGDIPIEKDEDL